MQRRQNNFISSERTRAALEPCIHIEKHIVSDSLAESVL